MILVMLELLLFARLLNIIHSIRKTIILLMNIMLNISILLLPLTLLNPQQNAVKEKEVLVKQVIRLEKKTKWPALQRMN